MSSSMPNNLKEIFNLIKSKKISKEDAIRWIEILKQGKTSKESVHLHELISNIISVSPDDLDMQIPLLELGMDTVKLNLVYQSIKEIYNEDLSNQFDLERVCVQDLEDALTKSSKGKLSEDEKTSDHGDLKESLLQYLIEMLERTIESEYTAIEKDTLFEQFGLDSIMVMDMTSELEEIYGSLPKTLFFEHQCLDELADYFVKEHNEKTNDKFGANQSQQKGNTVTKRPSNTSENIEVAKPETRFRQTILKKGNSASEQLIALEKNSEDILYDKGLEIAVVGLSGKYPQANNIEEYWENLKNGRDCITEIPKDRWNHDDYYDQNKGVPGKTYGKWGGFMEGVDEFDAAFFNISPIEAEILDPQERLFLQCAYSAVEDAGYTKQTLIRDSKKVGVYVGVMYEEYQLYGAQETIAGSPVALAGSPSSIANRVSYYFNLSGPSIAVDTMCSSSLTAIYMACQAIRSGQIYTAIAGGVNVSVHPNKYLMLAQGQFISDKGRCESFGEGGNGYVPGEGVGVVLLKPLKNAISDGDNIYGVIKGVAINHGGKTNGYSVPNPNAQAEVVLEALKEARVRPDDISYIEAHGTGTSLGDPIEIAGLNKAFKNHSRKNQFCSIGSSKSNIGHCESAAGIGGLTKILLQMKYGKLVPSLHSQKLNPGIDFVKSPFHVQQKLQDWNPESKKRIAGLSSFGAGGSNAHMIIEEYQSNTQTRGEASVLLTLSAKNSKALQEKAEALRKYFQRSENPLDLEKIAFTLQVGREEFDYRLALVHSSIDGVISALKNFSEGKKDSSLFSGDIKESKDTAELFSLDEDLNTVFQKWIKQGNHKKVAQLWVKGGKIDWGNLYSDVDIQKVSLPTYPFEKTKYWFPSKDITSRSRTLTGDNVVDDNSSDCILNSNFIVPEDLVLLEPYWETSPIAIKKSQMFDQRVVITNAANLKLENALSIVFDIDEPNISHSYTQASIKLMNALKDLMTQRGQSILVQILLVKNKPSAILFKGLMGMLKCAALEYPSLVIQCIESQDSEDLNSILASEKEHGTSAEVRYENKERLIKKWNDVKQFSKQENIWSDHSTYVITGGAGGVGFVLAQAISARISNSNIILTGRSNKNEHIDELLSNLKNSGDNRVEYYSCDVADSKSVSETFKTIENKYGKIEFLLHSAGVLRDSLLTNKTEQELIDVFSAKVEGVVNLHNHIHEDCKLILCSSLAGEMGNVGQSDYAAANAFMDSFVEYRPNTISVNWPLWKNGGMGVDPKTVQMLEQSIGLRPLSDEYGAFSLEIFLQVGNGHYIAMEGDASKLKSTVLSPLLNDKLEGEEGTPHDESVVTLGHLTELLQVKLKALIGNTLKMNVENIHLLDQWEEHGIDSIIITRLNQELDKYFKELTKTLFFECQNVKELSEYLLENHKGEVTQFVGKNTTDRSNPKTMRSLKIAGPEIKKQSSLSSPHKQSMSGYDMDDIAIIGLDGKYPMAKDVDEFWDNLKAGKDCISEIPERRWSMEDFYDDEKSNALGGGLSYSKWGGFLESEFDFDPIFFGMTPREVVNIDPQERLFLTSSWNALEDAGYHRKKLHSQCDNRVGVFAGITKTGFALHGPDLWSQGEKYFPNTSFSSVANRVSYFLNLQGPSIALDTMCSSSLTAIHYACESIRRDDCKMALAGGVNLYLHPSNYIALCSKQMLSEDGQCKAFGEGGNGFVPGEGVGTVVLKSKREAIKDGDNIYAVIKGSGVNHGGKVSGFTVPSPNLQGKLIEDVIRKSNVELENLSYVEAHGTGTELGDPIEITGLSKGFKAFTNKKEFCAIGSVKTNIGHLEAAAGIAGLTKIILQMKNGQLAPSLHANIENKNINFKNTPFKVQKKLSPWVNTKVDQARLASLSSFGAGGSNAHLIVEEYISPSASNDTKEGLECPVCVLSAKDLDGLKEAAENLLNWFNANDMTDSLLQRALYTLQTGREELNFRFAIPVLDLGNLSKRLNDFIQGNASEKYFSGFLNTNLKFKELDYNHFSDYSWNDLAKLWVEGVEIPWKDFYSQVTQTVSLPTYFFQMESFILPTANLVSKTIKPSIHQIHPLIHQNVSQFDRQEFTSTFTGDEEFLKDHVINGVKVLPGVCYPEMAIAALNQSVSHESMIHIKNAIWAKRIEVKDTPVEVITSLDENGKGHYEYNISTDSNGEQVHSKGSLTFTDSKESPFLDIENLKEQCSFKSIDHDAFYSMFDQAGLNYGSSHRCVLNLSMGEHGVLTELEVSSKILDRSENYFLAPSIMDAAFQSIVGVLLKEGNVSAVLPFAMDDLIVYDQTSHAKFVWCRKCEETIGEFLKVDIDLADGNGVVLVSIKGLNSRTINNGTSFKKSKSDLKESIMGSEKSDELNNAMETYLKGMVSDVTDLPKTRLDVNTPFEQYGIDSVVVMELTDKLEKDFGSLPKTLFFEYQTISVLGTYLLQNMNNIHEALGVKESAVKGDAKSVATKEQLVDEVVVRSPAVKKNSYSAAHPIKNSVVAIIGIEGKFPGANSIAEFWDKLSKNENLIQEIPKDRWDVDKFYSKQKDEFGKSYSKWGGFIEGALDFDPMFFSISPNEAKIMDPKERLLLETAWNLFESAGITRGIIKEDYHNNIGVYVGAMYQQYHSFDSSPVLEAAVSVSSYSSMANRISYFFDLSGPSIALDTLCSSSMTAIDLAIKAIRNKEINAAVVGAANLNLHPNKYIGLSLGQMLGSTSDSLSFSNGDGYLPAEGVSVALLKSLEDAERDGDNILGIIKSSFINHNGKSSGYSVPNPVKQAELIETNLKASDIEPHSISYIECAANGSAMGDSIEFVALNKAFHKVFKEKKIPIGAVKSNMGHAEAVSGMSQLAKVLYQLKNKTILPAISPKELNPNLDFENAPFYLPSKTEEWENPVINDHTYPLRACISSFGAGGSNAHLIVEEYRNRKKEKINSNEEQWVAPISAHSKIALKKKLEDLIKVCTEFSNEDFLRTIYTLQCRREPMEYRVAFVVKSAEELVQNVKQFLNANMDKSVMFYAEPSMDASEFFELCIENKGIVEQFVSNKNLHKLSRYWVEGGKINWGSVQHFSNPDMIALSLYPFQHKEYTLDTVEKIKDSTAETKSDFFNISGDNSKEELFSNIVSLVTGLSKTEVDLYLSIERYGLDSITIVQLSSQLKKYIDSSITVERIMECQNFSQLMEMLDFEKQNPYYSAGKQFVELIPLNEVEKGRPVFWIHAGLGGVEAYQEIAKEINRPFFGIQAKGWMTHKQPLEGIYAMAAYYVHIIRTVQPEGPYDVGGYSLGGTIAYEVTRQLQELDQKVNSLVMIDSMYLNEEQRDHLGHEQQSLSYKTQALQAVNTMIMAMSKDNDPVFQDLIHHEQVDVSLDDTTYLNELADLCTKKGVFKSKEDVLSVIQKNAKVQSVYGVENYQVYPLPKQNEVKCLYLLNQSGMFLGEFEPYYSAKPQEIQLDHLEYWNTWEKEIADFVLINVPSKSHLEMLNDSLSMKIIQKNVGQLYDSREKLSIPNENEPTLIHN